MCQVDNPRNRRIAEAGEFFRVEVGSGLHGIDIGGTDDRDEMGLCIEPRECVIGLNEFEQYVFRTAPEGVRSKHGDLDLTVYSLRKWMRLALNGNPTILLLLYAPGDKWLLSSPLARKLQALAPALVSKRAGKAFLGYLTAQKQRLLRERGTAHVPNRGDRDGKYASHMVRLGYQGVELMSTGHVTLPMPEEERQFCLSIKRGEADLDVALTKAGQLAREIEDLLLAGPLPDEPDRDAANDFLIYAYRLFWEGTPTDRGIRGMGKRVQYTKEQVKSV